MSIHVTSDNFDKGIYRNATYSVQILEKLEPNSITARNALCASMTCKKSNAIKHGC